MFIWNVNFNIEVILLITVAEFSILLNLFDQNWFFTESTLSNIIFLHPFLFQAREVHGGRQVHRTAKGRWTRNHQDRSCSGLSGYLNDILKKLKLLSDQCGFYYWNCVGESTRQTRKLGNLLKSTAVVKFFLSRSWDTCYSTELWIDWTAVIYSRYLLSI